MQQKSTKKGRWWREATVLFCSVVILVGLGGCGGRPQPRRVDNVCAIFMQYPDWYLSAKHVQHRWGVPISIQMAIIYQESSYHADIRPPRTKLLWIIPWRRPTSAYGYAQAVDDAWRAYKKEAGHFWSRRNRFQHAIDFIGWFVDRSHRIAHIPRNAPYAIYLAYHEGIGGYQRRTFRKKYWLKRVAHKVSRRARRYHYQLIQCREAMARIHPWWSLW